MAEQMADDRPMKSSILSTATNFNGECRWNWHPTLRHTQAQERADILNIGGFSDQVFNLLTEFANGNLTAEHWVGVIERLKFSKIEV